MADKCKECGCICKQCNRHEKKHSDMHLHAEIENLRRCLFEKDSHIVTMETHFLNEAKKFPNGELASLKEELLIWQEKYSRLYESHKRVQKVNQNLEDKLLKIVDKCETEKGAFTKDIATLSHRLADANYTIHRLTQDNEKYRNDVSLAIQLLQCKPSNFVAQKYESLPPEVQTKVRTYVAPKGRNNRMPNTEVKSITVPISTYPPTAMVYSVAKPVVDNQDIDSDDDDSKPVIDTVSAAIMAKVLEDREKERIFAHHCNTCTCHRHILKVDTGTQTLVVPETSSLISTKDYFNRYNSSEVKSAKYNKDSSQSDFRKSRDPHRKASPAKIANVYCATDVGEGNDVNIKVLNQSSLDAKNYLNLKNSSKLQSTINEKLNMGDKSRPLSQDNKIEVKDRSLSLGKKSHSPASENQRSSKSFDDQAKLDIINERLWKNSWMNSQTSLKENEPKLEVINDRVWRESSKLADKPAPYTVIEIKSPDDLTTTTSEKHTTSPSFSTDSIVISSSDPSSLASDTNNKTSASKNILLDNMGTYQTVVCYNTTTAKVHAKTSSRTVSVSSEDDLQRVAQWVDTLSDCDSSGKVEEPLLSNKTQDLMTFEAGLSDEELKLNCQPNISEEMEQTYLKLAASLELTERTPDVDMMTIEKYREEQKRLYKCSQAKLTQPKT